MAIESVGTAPTNSSSNIQRAGLGQEDFLKILLTQLTYQDPLKPMDNQEFIAQMAQFTSLEQTQQSNEKLDQLLVIQESSQSLGYLNKNVEVDTIYGRDNGKVIAVRFEDGVPLMTVKREDGQIITPVKLTEIKLVQ